MWRTQDVKATDACWQWHRATNYSACALGCINNLGGRLINKFVIKCFQTDADFLIFHDDFQRANYCGPLTRSLKIYFKIFATTPAPTVRPPSRIAKRKPSSMAIGLISFTVIDTLSPGMTISLSFGNSIEPVTSVVRK